MNRLVRLLSFASVLFTLAHPVIAQEAADPFHPHIRTANERLRAMMSAGVQVSPTLHGIVKRIETSDVIVYLDMHILTTPGVAAQSQFVQAAGGRRFVRVVIDSRFSGAPLVGLLGHELQHVAEIAGEPTVVDPLSLAAFYRRIGFKSPAGGTNRFESAAAIATGRRVMQDAIDHPSEVNAAVVRVKQAAASAR
jgi:hypothetical protein